MNHSIFESFSSKFFFGSSTILPFFSKLQQKFPSISTKLHWDFTFPSLHHHIICYGGFTESSFKFGQSSENCIKYCLVSQGGVQTKSQLEENSETCLVLILIPKYEIQCYGSYAVSRIIQIDFMSANSEK